MAQSANSKMPFVILGAGLLLLVAAIVVQAIGLDAAQQFPWGIHLVTVPAVALIGVAVGWAVRDKQAADERARAEIEDEQAKRDGPG
jgi:fluoride ion exporter CrcB/FEX